MAEMLYGVMVDELLMDLKPVDLVQKRETWTNFDYLKTIQYLGCSFGAS